MTIQAIILDQTQIDWVNAQNEISENKALFSNDGVNDYIVYDVMTLVGFEAYAAYFSGVTPTDVVIADIL